MQNIILQATSCLIHASSNECLSKIGEKKEESDADSSSRAMIGLSCQEEHGRRI